MTDVRKMSDAELAKRYRELTAKKNKPKEEKKEGSAVAKAAALAGNAFLQPDNPVGQGARKAIVTAAGLVADAPQNLWNLTTAGIAPIRKMIYPEEDLPEIDSKRIASSWLLENTRPAWEYNPKGPGDRALNTAGEIGMAGLIGGVQGGAKLFGMRMAPTTLGRGLTYNVGLPVAGGVIGEQIGGDTGKLAGTLAAPLGVGAVESLVKGGMQIGARPGAVEALQDVGIPPVAGDVGPVAGTFQRGVELFPTGYVIGSIVARKRAAALQAAVDKGMPVGRASAEEAGEIVTKGLKNWTTRFENTYQVLDKRAAELFPEATPVPLTKTAQVLAELSSPSVAREAIANTGELAKFRRLQEAIASGQMPAGELRKLKSDVGAIAFPKFGQISDAGPAQWERLWKAMAEDMEAAAVKVGPEAASATKKANAFYKSGKDKLRNHFDGILKEVDMEKVFNGLMTGGKSGAERLRRVTKAMTRDERDVLASAALTRMGRPVASAVDQVFSSETFLTNWRQLTPESKRALFGGTNNPDLMKTLDKVSKAAGVMRETARTLPNPSGSAAGVTATASIGGALWEPVTLLASVGGPTALEVLFTRPWFAKWLSTGANLPDSALPNHIIRFTVLAQKDPELRQHAEKFEIQPQKGYQPVKNVDAALRSISQPQGAR